MIGENENYEKAMIESLKEEAERKMTDLAFFSNYVNDTLVSGLYPLLSVFEELKNKISLKICRLNRIQGKIKSLDISQQINTSKQFTTSGVQIELGKLIEDYQSLNPLFEKIPFVNEVLKSITTEKVLAERIEKVPASARFRNPFNSNSDNNIEGSFNLLARKHDKSDDEEDDDDDEVEDAIDINSRFLNRKSERSTIEKVKPEKEGQIKKEDKDEKVKPEKEGQLKKGDKDEKVKKERKEDELVTQMKAKFGNEKINKINLTKLTQKILWEKAIIPEKEKFLPAGNFNYKHIKIIFQVSPLEIFSESKLIDMLKGFFHNYIFSINNPDRKVIFGGTFCSGIKLNSFLEFMNNQNLDQNFKITTYTIQAYAFFPDIYMDIFLKYENFESNLNEDLIDKIIKEFYELEGMRTYYQELLGAKKSNFDFK